MPVFAMPRVDLKEGDCLCNHCTALCCRYFSLPIQSPESPADYADLKRFLTFDRTTLFVEGDNWYLVVQGDCQYLTPDYRCGIYSERPAICGQYTTDGCEYDNDVLFEKYFEIPDQIEEYAEAVLSVQKPSKRKPKGKQNSPVQYILPPELARGRDHFIVKIDEATSWDDFDNCRWYLTHGPVSLLVSHDTWYLVVFRTSNGTHGKLGRIDAGSSTNGVRRQVIEIDRYFESPEQIWDYAAAILPPREPLDRDQPQKLSLPVLNNV